MLCARMGVMSSTALPTPEYDKRHNPIYEVELNGQQRLRPAWERDWDVNEGAWGGNLVHLIQADGHKYSKDLTQDEIATLTPGDILEAVHQTFRSWRRRWSEAQQDVKTQELKRKAARRNQRKRKVGINSFYIFL